MPPRPSCHFAATACGCMLILRVGHDKKMPGAKSGADYPDYIALRTADDGGRLLTVVAALEPEGGSLFPWAMRYHAQAPSGEFRKAPGNYIRLWIDTAVAKSMIDLQ